MSLLGNILWFIFVGWWHGLAWMFVGILWCLTIVGIPVGVQCFKIATLVMLPFGKEIVDRGDAGSLFLNILWIIFGGIELALGAFFTGCVLCVTIVGIPFGIQCFKIARLSLMPFGSEIVG